MSSQLKAHKRNAWNLLLMNIIESYLIQNWFKWYKKWGLKYLFNEFVEL